MLYFLPPDQRRRYRPPVRTVIGIALVVWGIAASATIPFVIGAALLLWAIWGFICLSRSCGAGSKR